MLGNNMSIRQNEHDVILSFSAYCVSFLLILCGISFGALAGIRDPRAPVEYGREDARLLGRLCSWDAVWYSRILRTSYDYDAGRRSSVAFFPAYPLLGRFVRTVTGATPSVSLLIVAHVSLVCVFLIVPYYVQGRCLIGNNSVAASERQWVVVAMAFWPTTFFFRMAYSEALFLLLIVGTMYGIQQKWPVWRVVLLAGATTACRPVGVAILPVIAWWLWRCRTGNRSYVIKSLLYLLMSAWGLIAYMFYLHIEFGNALAFAQTQQHWSIRSAPFSDRVASLVVAEPIWSVYVPSSAGYWGRNETHAIPVFSLQFLNPIYFVVTGGLVGFGAWRGWLSTEEVILSAGLLLIPYATHGYQVCLMSHARYAAIVFPVYIVVGKLLQRCGYTLASLLCVFSGFLLGTYSALFAGWYRMV